MSNAVPFGTTGDIAVPNDHDGDGRADLVVFRPSNGVWYMQQSTAGFAAAHFGTNGDKPVPADYDGDGKTDIAVYRNGAWYLLRSQAGFIGVAFGVATDIPVAADYNGDGRSEIGVFRPSEGNWYIYNLSTGTFSGGPWGTNGDIPTPSAYVQ